MEAQDTVLRSGRRWRRSPAPRREPRRRKGPAAQPLVAPSATAEGTQGGERSPEGPAAASHFGCNVCLETARDPVVTHCGHLFCWPCLYRWVAVHSPSRDCPVCKSAVEIGPGATTVTPIYGRGDGGGATAAASADPDVPPRPQGQRIPRPRGATVREVLEEVRQRAEVLRRQAQMQTIDRTRAAIDRVRANLQAVEGLVREFSLGAARLRVGQVAVEVERVSVATTTTSTPLPELTPDRTSSAAETMAGRSRRREGDQNPRDGEDGVYRGTRRRRMAAERGS